MNYEDMSKKLQWEKTTSENIKIIDFVVMIEETTRLADLFEFGQIDQFALQEYRQMWIDYGYDMSDIVDDGLYDFGIATINTLIDDLSKKF